MICSKSVRAAGATVRPRTVATHAFRPVHFNDAVVASVAGSILLAAPAFAVLPEGFSSPQGSNTATLEARLDSLIEQRTGKASALPELTEVPQAAPPKKEAPVVVAAPMAPAVAEPPAPARPAEAAPAPAPAPAKAAGLQARSEPGPAASSAGPAAPSSGLLIGGSVATLGVVAAAALANKGGEGEGAAAAAAAPAAAAPAAAAAEASPEPAAVSGGGAAESANPSSKAE